MESIRDKVAIIGMGCTRFGERWDMGLEELLVEAAGEAFADAGLEPKDIQAAWLGNRRLHTGRPLAQALKLSRIPITRVENACASGTDAFRNACFAVAAGAYDIVLVAGAEKLKDAGISGLGGGEGAPSSGVEPHQSAPVPFALRATRYAHAFGLSHEELKATLGKIAVKNHRNGSRNPKAHLRREVTLEQVVKAPTIAWPLGLYDCCGVSDGAAIAIVCRADMAKSFRDDYVLVKGLGLSCSGGETLLDDSYDFLHFPENVSASQMAYAQAGIKDPLKELDVAEVHDCFTITELLIYEDLGWCPKGRAKEFIDSGVFAPEGELPVNVDGGLKCFGHPVGASGVRMIYEVYRQLQGRALGLQVQGASLGLTHNLGADKGAFVCSVTILGQRH